MDAEKASDQNNRPSSQRRMVASTGGRGVSFRALVIAFALTPLNIFFLVQATWRWGGFTGGESLFTNTVAILFLLALLNLWLKKVKPAWSFRAGEMLTVYIILGIGTGLTSSVWDLGGALPSYITYPFWFASPENDWEQLLWRHLPSWLTVQDISVLEGFYLGRVDPYQRAILAAWAVPALSWAALVGALMWVCLCLNSIVRRRWEEEERLPFPLTVLPVQLSDERSGLLHNRLFWLAVSLSAGLQFWGAIASLAPSIPAIPMGFDYTTYVQNNPPWSFIRYTSFHWNPFALGLAYLIPLDLAFSLFIFNLLWTAEYIMAGHFGWAASKWSGFPYGEQQTAGAFLALTLTALWLDRRYFRQVIRRVLGLNSRLQEESEAFGYRGAVLGALAGMGFLWWMLGKTGMDAWTVGSFIILYFLMALVISRLRAQLGPPTHQLYGAMPNWVLSTAAGSRILGPNTMGMFYILQAYLQEQRNHPGPIQLEALKMAEGGRMERRRIAIAMAIVAPLAMLLFFWATIHVGYERGMGTGNSHQWLLAIPFWATGSLDANLRNPGGPNTSGIMAIGVGAAITFALYFMKLRFYWWPLHPVAFPIAIASTIQGMTVVIFAAWLIKALLLRYGGLKSHRMALPFFLGLLAGDATASLLRALVWAAFGLSN